MKQAIHCFVVFVTVLALLGAVGTGIATAVPGTPDTVTMSSGMDCGKCEHSSAKMAACTQNFCGFPSILPYIITAAAVDPPAYFSEASNILQQHESRPSLRPA